MNQKPLVSVKVMSKTEEIAHKNYGIDPLQMVELAGMKLSRFAGSHGSRNIAIFFGKGDKGAAGLSCARQLINHGYDVQIIQVEANAANHNEQVKHHLKTLKAMGVTPLKDLTLACPIIIDCMLDYDQSHKVNKRYGEMITRVNDLRSESTGTMVISLDLPSGLSADTGEASDAEGLLAVRADYTITLSLPKLGFKNPKSRTYTGRIFVADVGLPTQIYEQAGISP